MQNLTDFKRQPEKPAAAAAVALSEAELKKFAGRYELAAPPLEVSIELVGGQLKAVMPARPVTTLVPVSADRFTVEGAPVAIFVQFKLEDGKVSAMTIEQGSNPALTFKPKT